MSMDKHKKIIMVLAPDVMQKYFEGANDDGSDESKLGEVIEKCKKFPDKMQMRTPTSAFIFALKKAERIDGDRIKNFLEHVQLGLM